MVKEVLVDNKIEAGRRLTEDLTTKAGLEVAASFWLYEGETNDWRLTIASPSVDREDTREVYRKIQTLLAQDPELSRVLDLRDIYLAGPEDRLVKSLRKGLHQRKLGGVRISGGVVGGHYVEDAYVYRAA
jgi:hypothetical protein